MRLVLIHLFVLALPVFMGRGFVSSENDPPTDTLRDDLDTITTLTTAVSKTFSPTPSKSATDPAPKDATTVPKDATTAPKDATTALKDTTTVPKGATTAPKNAMTAPKDATTAPKDATTAPKKITTAPKDATTAPKDTTTAPKDTTTAPKDTTTAPKDATTAPKDTTTAPKDATTAPKDATTAPKDTTTAPKEATTAPKDTTTAPKEATTAPKDATTAPKDTTTAPKEATTAPKDATTAPKEATTAPKDTTTAPKDTTTAPKDTTTAPKEATTAPKDATTAPKDATTAPKDTTTAPKDTTTAPKDTTRPFDNRTTPGSTADPVISDIHISETNILIWKGNTSISSWFIELKGKANESLDGLTLAVQDATKAVETSLFELRLNGELDENGFFLVNHDSGHEGNSVSELENFEEQLKEVQAILLLLYYGDIKGKPLSQDAVKEFLLYSVIPDLALNAAIREVFLTGESQLIVNLESFQPQNMTSLSRCPFDSPWALLAPATPGSPNQCQFNVLQLLEMKLSVTVTKCDSTKLPHTDKLKTSLITSMITNVNTNRQCGLTPVMLSDVGVIVRCKDKTIQEYPVRFTVHAAFEEQMAAIVDGYKSFIRETAKINLNGNMYDVTDCTTSCFKHAPPPSDNGGDDNVKITVAAVMACIAIFIAVLLFVIIYMKRKRRGILQFRMARLDEDDDDLIADMDDFVGNQGATFSNFR